LAVFNIIKSSFIQFYDHLFKLIFINLIWFLLMIAVLFVGYTGVINQWYLPLIVPLLFTGPFFLSGLHITDKLILSEDTVIKDFFNGIINYFKRGLSAFVFTTGIYIILVIDLIFFVQKGRENVIFLIIGILFIYLILFFSMMQIYFWGLLTVQKEERLMVIIKRSFLLTMDNIIFIFLLLLFLIILTVVLTITGVGLPLLFLVITGLLICNGTRFTLKKYQEE